MMTRAKLFGSFMVVVVLVGCGGSGGGGGGGGSSSPVVHASGPGPVPPGAGGGLEPGSGQMCPTVTGRYVCTPTNEERAAGKTEYHLRLHQVAGDGDFAAIKIKNGGGTDTYVTDGQVHQLTVRDAVVQYVIDCGPRTLTLHAISAGHFDIRSTLQLRNGEVAGIVVTGTSNGQPVNGQRFCQRD